MTQTSDRCYQTQYTDPTTGDVLMQARWYTPGTATFRSRDTYAGDLNTPVTLNRYTYAGNNPIRYSDPNGHCFAPVQGAPACDWAMLKGLDEASAYNAAIDIQKQIIPSDTLTLVPYYEETGRASPLTLASIAHSIQVYAVENETGVYQAGREIQAALRDKEAAASVYSAYIGDAEIKEVGGSMAVGAPRLLMALAAAVGVTTATQIAMSSPPEFDLTMTTPDFSALARELGTHIFSDVFIDPTIPTLPRIEIPGTGQYGFPVIQDPLSGLSLASTSPLIDPADVAGSTPVEIDQLALERGLIARGPDPQNGRSVYLDPVTGQQRLLCHPYACPPHAHVNDPQGNRLDIYGNVVPRDSEAAHLPINLGGPK